jgi:hypothetical protein
MTTTAFGDRAIHNSSQRRRANRLDTAAQRISIVTVVLMVVAAAAGLRADDLYRDPAGLRHMLRGHDFVTLVGAAPLLAWSMFASRTGHGRARLVWLGSLAFATYNYALYVFGSGFNDLFLVHVVILETGVVALALGLASTAHHDVSTVSRRAGRIAAALLLFLAVGLGAMWVFNAVRFALTGNTPSESQLVLPLASTHLGYALDLLLIVPAYVAAAVLLWRRSSWGDVLAPAYSSAVSSNS